MSFRIELSPEAKHEISELPAHVRARALHLLHDLALDPRSHRARELRSLPSHYRVWLAGRWRIVYHLAEDLQRVRILRVRLKEQIDYDSVGLKEEPDDHG